MPEAPQPRMTKSRSNLPPLIVGLSPKTEGEGEERTPSLLDHLHLEPHEKVNHKTFQNGTLRVCVMSVAVVVCLCDLISFLGREENGPPTLFESPPNEPPVLPPLLVLPPSLD